MPQVRVKFDSRTTAYMRTIPTPPRTPRIRGLKMMMKSGID